MKIKRFVAPDMRTALIDVKAELGADAIIMSNKKISGGVEIMAAVDYEQNGPQSSQASEPANHLAGRDFDDDVVSLGGATANHAQPQLKVAEQFQAQPQSTQQQAKPASSLEAILQRQQQKDNQQVGVETRDNFGPRNPEKNDKFVSAEEFSSMQSEMQTMRQLLEFQLSGLMKQDMERKEPIRAMLVDRLKKLGVFEHVADQIACFIPDDMPPEQAFNEILNMFASQLSTTNDDIMRRGGVVALMGPTGVGKTTTIAKLAARFAQKHGADQVALITTDTYRIGANEQLATYGKILGCPVKVAKDEIELKALLQVFADKKLVLIDTAGMSQRDRRLTAHLSQLINNSHVKIKSYLVLSATSQHQVLQDTVKHFKRIPLSGCIFTKLDEAMSLGEIMSTAIMHALPVGYVTTGQRVPEDIEVANAARLVELAHKRSRWQEASANEGFLPQAVTM